MNNKKINMIKEDEKWIIDYNSQKEGIYQFEIVFNNIINDMNYFFDNSLIHVQILFLLIYQILIVQMLLIWRIYLVNALD